MGLAERARPPWGVSAPDLDVGAWEWVQSRGNRRSSAAAGRTCPGTNARRILCPRLTDAPGGFVLSGNTKTCRTVYQLADD